MIILVVGPVFCAFIRHEEETNKIFERVNFKFIIFIFAICLVL
jgi:hypothetical protein